MLSPLHDLSMDRYIQIASILGYFYHGGAQTEHILLVLATITIFPPLIVNFFRVLEHADLNVLKFICLT